MSKKILMVVAMTSFMSQAAFAIDCPKGEVKVYDKSGNASCKPAKFAEEGSSRYSKVGQTDSANCPAVNDGKGTARGVDVGGSGHGKGSDKSTGARD